MSTAFNNKFEELLLDLGNYDPGHEKRLAMDKLFDFLLENKTIVDSLPNFKRVLEIRLIGNTYNDYKFRAYHYLHKLCDVDFKSYYDEENDVCVEYFYDTDVTNR